VVERIEKSHECPEEKMWKKERNLKHASPD